MVRCLSVRVVFGLASLVTANLLVILIMQSSTTTQSPKKDSPWDNLLLPSLDPRSYRGRNRNGQYNTFIILYTKQRCGSTFMGEAFNKHPDIFYIFEPLNQVHWDYLYAQGEADVLIRDTFGCNSRHMEAIARTAHRKFWVQRHLYCRLDDQNRSACDEVDHKANLTKIDMICKMQPYKATKIITLPGLHLLEPYVNEGAKVIVGVRDPRGVLPSRYGIERNRFNSPRDFYDIAMVYCTEMLTDLHFLHSKWLETPDVISEAFHLVRYEDMAMDPVRETREIYKFLNIPIHQKVLTWAQGVANGSKFTVEQQYGTERGNSTRTSQRWKEGRKVPLSYTHLIEDACRPLMKLLGYKFVHEIQSGSNSSEFMVHENLNYAGKFDRNVFFKQ